MLNISSSVRRPPDLNAHTQIHLTDKSQLLQLSCMCTALTGPKKLISAWPHVFSPKCLLSQAMIHELWTRLVRRPHVHTVACGNLHMRLLKAAWPLTKGMMGGGRMWCGRWGAQNTSQFPVGLIRAVWLACEQRAAVTCQDLNLGRKWDAGVCSEYPALMG